MKGMRFWLTIAASVVFATIATAFPFLPPLADLIALLLSQWSAVAVIWFGSYGIAAALMTAVATLLEIVRTFKRITREVSWGDRTSETPRQLWRRLALHYLRSLALTQYCTSVVVLLSLGLSHVPVETSQFLSVAPMLTRSPAFAAGGAVILAGLLGAFALVVPLMRAASRLSAEPPQPLLVQPIVELLRVEAPPPTISTTTDAEQLSMMIEQSQRPTLEAIKGLAIAINAVGRGQGQMLKEIKTRWAEKASNRLPETTISPTAVEYATTELQAKLAALESLIAKMASLLPADEIVPVARGNAEISTATFSQMSTEFQALLQEIGETPTNKRSDDLSD